MTGGRNNQPPSKEKLITDIQFDILDILLGLTKLYTGIQAKALHNRVHALLNGKRQSIVEFNSTPSPPQTKARSKGVNPLLALFYVTASQCKFLVTDELGAKLYLEAKNWCHWGRKS